MRKISIVLFICSLFFKQLNAQISLGEQIKNAKLKIVRETVEFLSTDVNTFGKVKNTKCNCSTYAVLVKFASDNSLTKVPDLINEWQKSELDTISDWKNDLLRFKNDVINRITNGERSKRKELKGYAKYTATLDDIIKQIKPPVKTESPHSNVADNESEKDNKKKESAVDAKVSSDESSPISSEKKHPETQFTVSNEDGLQQTNDSSFILSVVPYVIIVLLAILLVIGYFNSHKKVEHLHKKLASVDKDNTSLADSYKKQIEKLLSEKKNFNEQIESLENDLKAERKRAQQTQVQSQDQQQQQTKAPQYEVKKEVKEEKQTMYARYADQGDGFSVPELLPEPDSETIFEVTNTSATTASFRVSNNINAQKYALSNASYFFGKTCKYDTLPASNSSIRTDVDGELKLQGNKWLIINPAKISFF